MFEADAGHSVAVENFAVPATSNEAEVLRRVKSSTKTAVACLERRDTRALTNDFGLVAVFLRDQAEYSHGRNQPTKNIPDTS
jgi:hypothetical protein